MSLTFLFAACAFVAVVGVVVACVDRWRESRLTLARPGDRVGVAVARVPSVPATRKRAA
jgi:hypothetical protein